MRDARAGGIAHRRESIRTIATPTVQIDPGAQPQATRARLERAAAMGLSVFQQVVSLTDPAARQRIRLARMRRTVPAAAQAITDHLQRHGRRYRCAMITATYRPGAEWSPGDISRLCDHYRQWLRRRRATLRAVWVLELQKRGAPHYHLLLWLPRGLTPPLPDKAGWWPHGSTNAAWARRPVAYLAKYASKIDSKAATFPKGARLFAIYSCPRCLDWWRGPAWVRKISNPGEVLRRARRGWWIFPAAAIALRSPWSVARDGPRGFTLHWQGWPASAVLDLWLYEARIHNASTLEA